MNKPKIKLITLIQNVMLALAAIFILPALANDSNKITNINETFEINRVLQNCHLHIPNCDDIRKTRCNGDLFSGTCYPHTKHYSKPIEEPPKKSKY